MCRVAQPLLCLALRLLSQQHGPGAKSVVSLVEADTGKLQLRGCSFGSDEPCIALRPGLKHAIVTENNRVRGVEILNEIGDQAVIAQSTKPEPERAAAVEAK